MNEYWIVTENKTGRVIAHCGDINDAIMMVSFDPQNRSYNRHRFIMDQVIDVVSTTDKQLPTYGIVRTENGASGSPLNLEESNGSNGPGEPIRITLPEGQGEPVVI